MDSSVRNQSPGRPGQDHSGAGAYGGDDQQDVQDAEKADPGAGV